MRFDDVLAAGRYIFADDSGVLCPRGRADGFGYTDGAEVEARLLALLQGTADRSVLSSALLCEIGDWPSRYHLSPRRSNLLRPLDEALRGRRVLEIGAGCGALTRHMGEIGAEVCAVEGSMARARVNAARCSGLENVVVVADTLQEIEPQPVFDVVTLIGVLEYARIFFPTPAPDVDPVDAMLERAAAFLRPGGILLVAIENQLGLKYFAGYHEDHVSQPFFGVEDAYGETGVVTFGRAELSARLSRAGLAHQRWLYPFPDYKLPTAVLTERGVSGADHVDLGALAAGSVLADPQGPPRMSFSLEQAWRPVMRNGLAGELANSFLAIGSRQPTSVVPKDVLAWHFAVERAPRYAKRTTFTVGEDGVCVEPALLAADHQNPRHGLGVPLDIRLQRTPFFAGELWQHRLVALLNRPGWTAASVGDWAAYWMTCLEAATGRKGCARNPDSVLGGEWMDAVPRNLLVARDQARFIDLEWVPAGGVSLGYLCYRAIVLSLLGVASTAPPANPDDACLVRLFDTAMAALGVTGGSGRLAEWHESERSFQALATGVRVWPDFSFIAGYRMPVR